MNEMHHCFASPPFCVDTDKFINRTISTIIKRRTLTNLNSLCAKSLPNSSRRPSWRYCKNAMESQFKGEGRGCKPHTETDENRVSSQAIFVWSAPVRQCHHMDNCQPLTCPAPHKHCQILKFIFSPALLHHQHPACISSWPPKWVS